MSAVLNRNGHYCQPGLEGLKRRLNEHIARRAGSIQKGLCGGVEERADTGERTALAKQEVDRQVGRRGRQKNDL